MTNRDKRNLVYFARLGNYVKIGTSTNVPQRLKWIGSEFSDLLKPDDLGGVAADLIGTVPGGRDREFDIQCDFWEWRVIGEWFEATPEVLAMVDDLLCQEAA